jgi:hypothetical protein
MVYEGGKIVTLRQLKNALTKDIGKILNNFTTQYNSPHSA